MSRVPRSQEHLKTGFTAEAVSAARFRAYAGRAEREGLSNLARRWLDLAAEKDRLAILQLEAAGQVLGEDAAVADAIADERFANDVLYPKMIGDVDEDTAAVLREVVDAKREQEVSLAELRQSLQAAGGDVP